MRRAYHFTLQTTHPASKPQDEDRTIVVTVSVPTASWPVSNAEAPLIEAHRIEHSRQQPLRLRFRATAFEMVTAVAVAAGDRLTG